MHCIVKMKVPTTAPTSKRYCQIRSEVDARLSSICADMPTPMFDQMVERIALVQLSYEGDPLEQMKTRLR